MRSHRPAATQPIVLDEQAIVHSLTQDNLTRVWASRRTREEERTYVVHVQGIATPLAVKKFQDMNPAPALHMDNSVKYRYTSEMNLLASNPHDNIIKVVDLIQREDAIMLVYEYPANGSLHSWLHQPMDAGQPLSWPEMKAIAIGVAQGLCHLHHGCNKPIIHHDISSHNILLDQNFKAVIASFGSAHMNMAGLGQPLPIMNLLPDNFGYTTPEYGVAASDLTEKVDTYSFGVLMLELVTGRVAIEAGAGGLLAIWAHNFTEKMAKQLEKLEGAVDKGIQDRERYTEDMAAVFRLGVDCTVRDPQQRPSMKMALKRLRRGRGRGPFRGLLAGYLL